MSRWRSWTGWAPALGAVHLLHSLWFARQYPEGMYDPDLLAYFVYFANWVSGSTALQHLPFFPVPKPLPVFLLAPLGDPSSVFVVSAFLSAWLGAVVFLIGRQAFGTTVGVLWSLLLLLDGDRAVLTLHSSADLYVTVLLLSAVWATMTRRYLSSGIALALAALVKPVTLPCALHLLAVDGASRRRAWGAAALTVVAIPLTLAANWALLGAPLGAERLFAGFDAISRGELMPPGELVRFVLWVQLVKHAFVASAVFGIVGLALWLGTDRRRLTHPLLLVPLLLLAGYLAMSIRVPFVPFFRFFWPIQVCFLGFIVFGIVETARRLAVARTLHAAVAAALLFFVADDLITRQLHYRQQIAEPFGAAMAFVESVQPTIAAERRPGETILTPFTFLPYVLWTLDDARAAPSLVTPAELASADTSPDWILWVPRALLDRDSRERISRLVASGAYTPRVVRGNAALLTRRMPAEPLAYLK